MDPYRTGQRIGTCPRCQNSTESDGELDRMVCVRGCGEWYSRERLKDALSWDELNKNPGGIGPDGQRAVASAWPWGATTCPVCQREMKVGFRAEVRFDFCGEHGLWLDSGEIERFAQAFKLS
jgi:Zn-finger nucleic acid-binding protein